jgi:hypothetical protein
MPEESLQDVAAAFTPFSEAEANRMRRYCDKAKELGECTLMVKPLGLDVKGGERREESGVKYEGSRAERSDLLMMFRPLYFSGQRDVSGFLKIAAMLRTHAEDKGGDSASQAAEMIAEHEAEHHGELVQSRGLELRMSGGKEVMSPETLLHLFLHGGDFHMDARLADYLEGLSPITRSVLEWEYLGTVRRLGAMYCQFAGFPAAILREPSLLP